MGRELVQWAKTQTGLTGKERLILEAVCDKVDPKQGGYFFKRLSDFWVDDVPYFNSLRAVRTHINSLCKKGKLILAHRGAGPRGWNSRLSRSNYYVNAGDLVPPMDEQSKMPLLTLIKSWDESRRPSYRSQNRPRFNKNLGRSAYVLAENQPSNDQLHGWSGEDLAENQLSNGKDLAENQPSISNNLGWSGEDLAENQPSNDVRFGRFSAKSTADTLLQNRRDITEEENDMHESMHGEPQSQQPTDGNLDGSPNGSALAEFDLVTVRFFDVFTPKLNELLDIQPPLTTVEMLAVVPPGHTCPVSPEQLAASVADEIDRRKDVIAFIDRFAASRYQMACTRKYIRRTYTKPSARGGGQREQPAEWEPGQRRAVRTI